MELKGKVAVVTGAGRGIGRAVALALAGHGCAVVLASRTENQLRSAAEEIAGAGGMATSVAVDLARKEDVDLLIRRTVEEYGRLDILVNNAGVLQSAPFLDITEEQWDNAMRVNLKAPFLLSQAALRIMSRQRSGYIINISSTAALQVPAGIAAYGTSKKAMIGLSEALYEAAKEYGVKVSVVYPGMTDTEMLRGFGPPVDPSRWMKTEDIVDCILFLLLQSDRVVIRDIVPWAARHDKI